MSVRTIRSANRNQSNPRRGYMGLRPKAYRPIMENLEDRLAPANLVVTLSEVSGTNLVSEAGGEDFYTIRLDSPPTNPNGLTVLITDAPPSPKQVHVDPQNDFQGYGESGTHTFTAANWAREMRINFKANNDLIKEGSPHQTFLTHTGLTQADRDQLAGCQIRREPDFNDSRPFVPLDRCNLNVSINDNDNAVPAATVGSYSVNEDDSLSPTAALGVLQGANPDTDGNNDPLIAKLFTAPTKGDIVLNSDGSFTYTPRENYSGPDSFEYRAFDGFDHSNVAQVTLTVNAVNDNPKAVTDFLAAILEDNNNNFAASGLTTNDTDPEGHALTVKEVFCSRVGAGNVQVPVACDTAANSPAPDKTHGTVTLDRVSGRITYDPDQDFNTQFGGFASFWYNVCDHIDSKVVGEELCHLGLVNMTVTAVNDSPVANNDVYTGLVNEDGTLTVALANSVRNNDSDVDNPVADLLVVPFDGPGNIGVNGCGLPGAFTLNPNGSFSYKPRPDFNGDDTFRYRLYDGETFSLPATVTIRVTAVNDAPIGVVDNVTVKEDESATWNVLCNDSGFGDAPLTMTIVTNPAHGVATITPAARATHPQINYVPQTDYSGLDLLTYRVCDSDPTPQCSGVTTVNIVVEFQDDIPDLPIRIARGLLEDARPAVTEFFKKEQTGPGALVFHELGDGKPFVKDIFFRQDGQAEGSGKSCFTHDSRIFRDSEVPNEIELKDQNGDPVKDADGNPVMVHNPLEIETAGELRKVPVDPNDLSKGYRGIEYKAPPGDQIGALPTDCFWFDVMDFDTPVGDTDKASGADIADDLLGDVRGSKVIITFMPFDDRPIAVDDNLTANEDTPTILPILDNDVAYNELHPEENRSFRETDFTLSIDKSPSHGTVEVKENPDYIRDAGLNLGVEMPPNLKYIVTYTPFPNYAGPDSFEYIVEAQGAIDTGLVTINVAQVNDGPIPGLDVFSELEDIQISRLAANGLKANDADLEGHSFRIELAVMPTGEDPQPQHGTLSLGTDGSFTYTPDLDFFGFDRFMYQGVEIASPNLRGPISVVEINVRESNDAPRPNTVFEVTEAFPEGHFVFSPDDYNVEGKEDAGDRVCDPVPGGTPRPFGIDVRRSLFGFARALETGANNGAGCATEENESRFPGDTIGFLRNDYEPEGQTMQAILISAPPGAGFFEFHSDGRFEYNPKADFCGVDRFTYRVTDGSLTSDLAAVDITVDCRNDDLRPRPDLKLFDEDRPFALTFFASDLLTNDRDEDVDPTGANPYPLTVLGDDPRTATPNDGVQVRFEDSNGNGSADFNATRGTVSISGDNGTITYVPVAHLNGDIRFNYVVQDALGEIKTGVVTVRIASVNDAPVANRDCYYASSLTPLVVPEPIGVRSNDDEVQATSGGREGQTPTIYYDETPKGALTISIVGESFFVDGQGDGPRGTMMMNPDGSFQYLAGADFGQWDEYFNYNVTDALGVSTASTIRIHVNNTPALPDELNFADHNHLPDPNSPPPNCPADHLAPASSALSPSSGGDTATDLAEALVGDDSSGTSSSPSSSSSTTSATSSAPSGSTATEPAEEETTDWVSVLGLDDDADVLPSLTL